MRLIYLAGPYSHHDKDIVQQRVNEYAAAVAYFMNTAENLYVFSPVFQCFHVANRHDLPHDFAFWAERDFFMIKKSSAMWVLPLEGWQTSYGLSQEIEYAESIQREIFYVVQESEDYVITDARPDRTLTIG